MDIKRYITIQAIKTKDNNLIPIWDENISFEKTELYGNSIIFENGKTNETYYDVVECIYDLKTKQISVGIELDFYPDESTLKIKKDDVVLYEKSHRKLIESKVVKIVYEEYDLYIMKGKKMEKWYINYFKDVNFENNTLYAIRDWKPYYILEDGTMIKYEHQLFHKYLENKN